MIVGDVRIRRSLRNQMFFQVAPRRSVIFAIVARFIQPQNRNLDRAIRQQLHRLLEKVPIARGIAVRRQSHDFVFVGIEIESEMQRDHRIQNSDRILCGDLGQLVDLIALGAIRGHAVRLAHSIEHDDQALVPARRVKRARRMRQVMIHLMHFFRRKSRQMLLHFCQQFLARKNFLVLLLAGLVQHERRAIRRVIESVRDLVDVADLDSRRIETILNRADRKIASVLLATESLLSSSCYNLAVHQ